MMHECIIRSERDVFAYAEQWLVGCRCHMGSTYKTWRPGDAPITCPVSGDDLTVGIQRGEEMGGGRTA